MSGLELAGELAGAFILGAACAVAGIYFYARKLFRDRFGQAAAVLLQTGTTPPPQ